MAAAKESGSLVARGGFDDSRSRAHAIGCSGNGKVKNESNPGWTVHNHHTWGTGLLLAPAMALTRLVAPENSGFSQWGYSLVNTMSILLGYLSVVGFSLPLGLLPPPAQLATVP